MSEHIVRRGARYYYRRRVPADLLSKLGREARNTAQSSGTSDPKEAARAARRMAVEVDDLFERLRTAPAHTPTAAARPVPLDVMLGEEWGQEEHELAPYTDADLLRAELTSIVRRVTGLESSARAFSAPPTAPAEGGHATVAAAPNHGGAALPGSSHGMAADTQANCGYGGHDEPGYRALPDGWRPRYAIRYPAFTPYCFRQHDGRLKRQHSTGVPLYVQSLAIGGG